MSGTVARASITVNGMAETSYASCGDLSLAYQVFGDGPVELVFVGPMVSHVELFWTMPEFKAFFEQLATFCRIVLFDKAGLGLSDPIPKVRTLDDRANEIEAVMDAVDFKEAAVFGMSEGGTASMVFAAKRPERTRALILYGTYPFMAAGWDDLDRDPAEVRARLIAESGEVISGDGEDYLPSTAQIARLLEMVRAACSAWGTGATAKSMFPSIRSMRQLAMVERMCASPGMVRASIESVFRTDIRPILSTIAVPTLVIHANSDLMPRAGQPLSGRSHPRRANARGRWRGPRALVNRTRQDLDRDRGVPHRQPCGTGAVASRPAHRVVHRHGRVDRTRRGDGRRAVAGRAAALW